MPETTRRRPVSLSGHKYGKENHRSGAGNVLQPACHWGSRELRTKTMGRYSRPRTLAGIGIFSFSQYTEITGCLPPSSIMVYYCPEMYTIHFSDTTPLLSDTWDERLWSGAEALKLTHFRPEGSGHRPETTLRLLYHDSGVSGLFRIEDRFVRSVRTQDMDDIWKDSCVEFFVQPKPDRGYLNFEFNCGGAMLGSHITDHERTHDGFRDFKRFTLEDCAQVLRKATMPRRIDPEISTPVLWMIGFFIPFTLLEKYMGPLGSIAGQQWKANAYKCGDETSHPHWVSWQPLPAKNFHLPESFGSMVFSDRPRNPQFSA